VGIVFKGSGFYVTDNRASSPTATPGKKSTDGESKKTSSESKTSESTSSDTD
jgi:predicted nucleic acid-binding Zn ribbon protein